MDEADATLLQLNKGGRERVVHDMEEKNDQTESRKNTQNNNKKSIQRRVENFCSKGLLPKLTGNWTVSPSLIPTAPHKLELPAESKQ